MRTPPFKDAMGRRKCWRLLMFGLLTCIFSVIFVFENDSDSSIHDGIPLEARYVRQVGSRHQRAINAGHMARIPQMWTHGTPTPLKERRTTLAANVQSDVKSNNNDVSDSMGYKDQTTSSVDQRKAPSFHGIRDNSNKSYVSAQFGTNKTATVGSHHVSLVGLSQSAPAGGDKNTRQNNRLATSSKQTASRSANVSAGFLSNPFTLFKYENAPFKQYSLNVQLSQMLPLHRHIDEIRPRQCVGRRYVLAPRHKVSVVVPFHNEMWAVLLRTVHALLDQSPAHLLHEILLIDDYSTFENLLAPLDTYVAALDKVRLVRLPRREGLIRARMAGARLATGNMLAFIDAHVEMTAGWLEPLVDLVSRQRTTIAVPVVNSINPLSFEYVYMPVQSRGVFTWDLDYVWKDRLVNYEVIGVEPHPTATMIGCAFLVDRDFFFTVGSFDEGMDIWGGEQLEISFRTWMCGGSVMIVPCSHVGHIYRAHLPYAFNQSTLYRNLQRVAEVWMDDYRRYFYYTINDKPHRFTPVEAASVQQRKDLRRRLRCKPFSWYLQHLAPDIEPPPTGSLLFGHLRNVGSQFCLTKYNQSHFDFGELSFDHCSLETKALTFSVMDTGHIVHAGECLTYQDTRASALTLEVCDQSDPHQLWHFRPGLPDSYRSMLVGIDVRRPIGMLQLRYGHYTLCLSQMKHEGIDIAGALDCGAVNAHQFWVLTYNLRTNRSVRDVYPEVMN